MSQTDELRIRVPRELKQTLKSLAKAKNITLNDLSILLLNQLLKRKPNLLSSLNSLVDRHQADQKMLQSYNRLLSTYSLLISESPENKNRFVYKSNCFIDEAHNFIQQLVTKHQQLEE